MKKANNKMLLYAPHSYHTATPQERAKVCNGCGAKGGMKFPDKMWGLEVKEACDIHDWMTKYGVTLMDFLFAAGMFIVNLTIIIWFGSANKFMMTLRLFRASKYFIGVVIFGLEHFYKDKKRTIAKRISYEGSFQ